MTAELKKQDEILHQQIYTLLECLRVLGIVLYPFIPGAADKINQQLGVKLGTFKDCSFGKVASYKVKKGANLFTKV